MRHMSELEADKIAEYLADYLVTARVMIKPGSAIKKSMSNIIHAKSNQYQNSVHDSIVDENFMQMQSIKRSY